ncbi:hypothetical protein GH811_06175 [Acetobacterium malicum]|jgi:hypothetical protein|uniref:Uncharacterized protein n=1 Tax=Acetobacterium malicum TaxID=52692 RepID=A0ABR6YVH7_9FIRM|nr:hypothetical protein [Acetobacterium malicum]MBC3899201.1 hypothetical protein [Acetobacterium malicum]
MKISGIVEVNDNVDIYQFWDEFIDFIESKGYYYGGGLNEVDEDGELIKQPKRGIFMPM